ncbi:MAG: AbrB/MazE/SpoVT family DNA-binding domain-containing protein [Ruminococcaceae bacterium]|nr:AbrB/MazE/SpoVT family DNA-binding domain-containing protein [Oscillospiraceae bacterium]
MTKFKKLSKSRGVTIPKDIAAHLDFDAGTTVDLTAADGKLIISKHVDTCRFCGGADNIKRFGDVFVCPVCAARLYKEVCG